MQKIRILCVGKIKESYFREAMEEYLKRIGRYARISVEEAPECPLPERAVEREGDALLPRLSAGKTVVLAVEGRGCSSEELAAYLKKAKDKGEDVTFVIGGSEGLDGRIKQKADELLSFSRMTLPHTLMRVVLCEQIYRALSITAGAKYHK